MTLLKCFSGEPDLFTKFLADKCTPLSNLNKLTSLYLKGDKNLYRLTVNQNDISTIISNLDLNKSHRWDNLLVRMIKLCGDWLIYPVKYIL